MQLKLEQNLLLGIVNLFFIELESHQEWVDLSSHRPPLIFKNIQSNNLRLVVFRDRGLTSEGLLYGFLRCRAGFLIRILYNFTVFIQLKHPNFFHFL